MTRDLLQVVPTGLILSTSCWQVVSIMILMCASVCIQVNIDSTNIMIVATYEQPV